MDKGLGQGERGTKLVPEVRVSKRTEGVRARRAMENSHSAFWPWT